MSSFFNCLLAGVGPSAQRKVSGGFFFFFFFSPELLEGMFVTILSQIGFASDLEVLCQKLLIDHWRDNRAPFAVLSTLEYLPLHFVTDSIFLSSSGNGQIKTILVPVFSFLLLCTVLLSALSDCAITAPQLLFSR